MNQHLKSVSVLFLLFVICFTLGYYQQSKVEGVDQAAAVDLAMADLWCDIRAFFWFPCVEETPIPPNEYAIVEESVDTEVVNVPAPTPESPITNSANTSNNSGTTQVTNVYPVEREIIREGIADTYAFVTRTEYDRQVDAIMRSIENNSGDTIVQGGGGGGLSDITGESLEDLSDVSSMTKSIGDLFTWTGTAWTNIATSSLNMATSQWITAGSDIYYTDGNVAIGTTTANEALTLLGNGDVSLSWGDTSKVGYLSWFGDDAVVRGVNALRFQTNLNEDRMIIDGDGNIGIGTTTPSSMLTVYGNTLLEGTSRYLNFGTVSGTSGYGFRDNAGTMEYKDNGGAWSGLGGPLTAVAAAGEAYDISNATFDGVALDVSGQEGSPTSLLFNNNGTVLYVIGTNTLSINAYTLSTPYDISTGSFDEIALDVSEQETVPRTMLFNNNGTVLYVMGPDGGDINAYTLSTPYDISTGSFDEIALDVSGQQIEPTALLFNNNGTVLYVMDAAGGYINAYTLSTPYDISTGSFDEIALDVSGQETAPNSLLFNNDGTVLYVMGPTMFDGINAYTLSTPYDISTGSFDEIALAFFPQISHPGYMLFNNDGTVLYVIEDWGYIYSYNIPVGPGSVYVTNTGALFGIGETSPGSKLSISGGASIGASYSTTGAPDNGLIVEGSVGIGTSTPLSTFTVVGSGSTNPFTVASSTGSSMLTIAADGNATFVGSGGTCTINGSGACSSDERLKTGFEALEGGTALEKLSTLRTGTYHWADASWDQSENIGVLAQDLLIAYPQLVGTASTTFMGVTDTYYTVNYAGLTVPIIAAIKELNLKLEDLATSTILADLEEDSFTTRFFNRLIAWFADTTNGIGTMVASVFNASEMICVDNECLTADDIRQLKEKNDISTGVGGSGDGETTSPTDVCPDLPDLQTDPNDCLPEEDTDMCPDIDGIQLTEDDCPPEDEPLECPEGETLNPDTNECIADTPDPIPGCMEEEAKNYNPEATEDDETCEYEPEDSDEDDDEEQVTPPENTETET